MPLQSCCLECHVTLDNRGIALQSRVNSVTPWFDMTHGSEEALQFQERCSVIGNGQDKIAVYAGRGPPQRRRRRPRGHCDLEISLHNFDGAVPKVFLVVAQLPYRFTIAYAHPSGGQYCVSRGGLPFHRSLKCGFAGLGTFRKLAYRERVARCSRTLLR